MLHSALEDESEWVRRAALEALAGNQNETAQRLLFKNFNPKWFTAIDPAAPITPAHVAAASHVLNLPISEIIARYRELAPEFRLTLAPELDAMTDAPSKRRRTRKGKA